MDDIGLSLGRAISDTLSHADPSTFVFLVVAICIQIAVILFLVIVAPIWIIRHYGARRVEALTLGDQQKLVLEDLERLADRIETRMASIETILDVESPNWKDRIK